jgi:biopolymer transport protein ExbB/TolQ
LTEIMRIFLAISNTLLYPVLISLILLVIYVFFSIGKALSEYASRRERRLLFSLPSAYSHRLREGRVSDELIAVFQDNQQPLSDEAEIRKDRNGSWQIADGWIKFQIRDTGKQSGVFINRASQIERNISKLGDGADIEQGMISERLSVFYDELTRVVKLCGNGRDKGLFTAKMEGLLEAQESEASKALEKNRVLIRVGPMLGLMGTLIPLGPALVALSGGNIAELSSNLIVAFSSTVVGLLIGAAAMVLNTINKRWYRQDLSDMEYTAENLAALMENGKTKIRVKETSAPL